MLEPSEKMLVKTKKCSFLLKNAQRDAILCLREDSLRGDVDVYYSEIGQIIEAGLDRDKEKVRSFATLLAKKMEADGEIRGSKRINNVLSRKDSGRATMDSLAPLPVDQESRMNIVDIDYNPEAEDLVLADAVRLKLQDFMDTIKHKKTMDDMGLYFSQSLLLYGYPGCGKTTAASYIAAELGLPLVTARLDTLISSLLGATAKNIHKIFEYAKRQPCVLFLDEFDAIAKARDDQHELGELKRVVNSLLQNIDDYCSEGILIAATNHQELLDNAIWRRFQSVIEMPRPGISEIKLMMDALPGFLKVDQIKENQWKKIYQAMVGLSYSDIKKINNNISKKAVLAENTTLEMESVIAEVYLFKNHGDYSKEDMAMFMMKCAVPKKRISAYTRLSRRRIDQLSERMNGNE